jgi:transposase-like protein
MINILILDSSMFNTRDDTVKYLRHRCKISTARSVKCRRHIQEATKKWTMALRDWGKVRGKLEIMYEDRFPE